MTIENWKRLRTSVVLTSASDLSNNVTLTPDTLVVSKVKMETAAAWSWSRSTNSTVGTASVRVTPVALNTFAGETRVGMTTLMAFVLLPSAIIVSAQATKTIHTWEFFKSLPQHTFECLKFILTLSISWSHSIHGEHNRTIKDWSIIDIDFTIVQLSRNNQSHLLWI